MNRVSQQKYDQALLLLPWYVTGKLTPEETTLVEEVLKSSPKLTKELEEQKSVSRMINQDPEVLDLAVITTQEQRLNSLLERIDQDQKDNESSTSLVLGKLRGWFSDVFTFRASNWGYALGAVFIFLQVAILVAVMQDNQGSKYVEFGLNEGSDGKSMAYNQGTDAILTFEFTPQASGEQIQKLFEDIGVKDFHNPPGSSNYEAVLEGDWTDVQIDALIVKLSKKSELVLMVSRGY